MNRYAIFEHWLVGYDPNMAHQYVIHTEFPRFICRVDSSTITSNDEFHFDLGDDWILREFKWIDPKPVDQDKLDTLLRRARSARATFNFVDAGILE